MANTRAVPTLCLVQFIDVLGVTVVVTAVPAMLRSFHASASGGTLIVAGYAMCFGGLLMTGARLGDRYGHRRAILASLVVYACGGLTGAVANSVLMLSVARCLQGACAAAAVPAALRLLTALTADGARRVRRHRRTRGCAGCPCCHAGRPTTWRCCSISNATGSKRRGARASCTSISIRTTCC